ADPATETILDCGLVSAPGPTGCVVIWRGGTSRITIRNGATSGALVHAGRAGLAGGLNAVLFRTDLVGGQRAFRIQHNSAAQAGIASTAVISQSILRDSFGSFAFGWQVQLSNAAVGSSVDLLVKNCTIARTRFGGFVAGLTSGLTITVRSEHNLYMNNHAALELDPARDAVALASSTGNTLDVTTESDRFLSNGPFSNSLSPTYWPSVGAISAKTAFRTEPAAGPHSNNRMRLTIRDPFFLDNSPADLLAYAAVSMDGGVPQAFAATEPAGVNNVLEVSIEAERGGRFIYCNSVPADPSGTDVVISDSPRLIENCSQR
ncbi:MAG TPA: hypothetical protein VFV54_05395, partial [Thermoanaerobaculia bacterium]|nr:hypothetical protein [Thermoanaerobaculia bacterium]